MEAIILHGSMHIIMQILLTVALSTTQLFNYTNRHFTKHRTNLETIKIAHSIIIHGINQIMVSITHTQMFQIKLLLIQTLLG